MIIFDFDGTISNSFPWFLTRINHVARVMGFKEVHEEDRAKLRTWSTDDILKYLGISSLKLPFVVLYMKWLMNKETHQIQLFPQVATLFKVLQDHNIKIVILSSNSKKNVKMILRKLS